MYTVYQKPA